MLYHLYNSSVGYHRGAFCNLFHHVENERYIAVSNEGENE
jgi:hypothetical protein